MFKQKITFSLLIVSLCLGQLGCGGGSQPSPTQGPSGSGSLSRFKPGLNLFSPQQDIQMGQESAQQVMRETPILDDPQITGYVRQLGAKLASKASGEKFPYQFWVVATKEINAFALPGGFLFVNAGAITAARNEGELAGVMAHEISHVALRHGTNQASKQQLAQLGLGLLGTIAASGDNPNMGQAVNMIGGLGANMLFLKFGRGAEKEADLEGARILAEAGYDPHDMANFFQTLQAEGSHGPEMLSDHPDPGNRIQYINDEIARLPVSRNPIHTTPEFEQAKARLTGRAPSLSSKSQLRRIGPSNPSSLELKVRPPRPSGQFQGFQANDGSFALQFPSNWDAMNGGESNYIFAPKGAYGKLNDSLMVTHGIFVGAVKVNQADLSSATMAFIQRQIDTNADFQIARQPQRIDFGGREGYVSAVAGPSAINGVVEVDVTYTTATADGRMFYIITIAPQDESQVYQAAFQQILSSIKLAR